MTGIPEALSKAAVWRSSLHIEKSKVNSTWMALRNSLATALPLGIGIALGNPVGAVAITLGALNVSYSDGRDPYAQRARRMLTWCFLEAIAVFLGSVTGQYHVAAIFIAAAWAFLSGMLVSLGTRMGDLGLNTLVVLVVFAARGALSPIGALYAALLVFGGGLLQTGFALLFWPIRRNAPERQAVGAAFSDLAKQVEQETDALLSAPLRSPNAQMQEVLSALGSDHSTEGERFRLLFDQADRIRMSVLVLQRLKSTQLANAAPAEKCPDDDLIHKLLSVTSQLLHVIGECLINGEALTGQNTLLEQLEALVQTSHSESFRQKCARADEISSAVDTLAGQLRAVVDLTTRSVPAGSQEFVRREAAQPWRFQIRGAFATLRANLDIRSGVFRHAVRLAVWVAMGDALGRSILGWQRSYWIPMTIAVVLKPDFTTTFSRGLLRLVGTYVGLALATILYHALPASALTQLLLVGIFTFLLRKYGPANYGIFSVAVSGLIVFLLAATGVSPAQVVLQRTLNTTLGGALALLAYALWPTWERRQISDVLSTMIDACRDYFHNVVRRFEEDDPALEANLDEKRKAWRRARSNAEASVDRVASEPGVPAAKLNCLASIMASSYGLAYSVMALEAGLRQSSVHTTPQALRTFANDVESTLYFIAAALRGSTAAEKTLPKLREDHRRLVEARASFAPQDDFVLYETDRITTTLNTLREQVVRFVG